MPAADAVERWFERSRASGWFANGGPCHTELRDRLAAYVGQGVGTVPVASGTAGLLVALQAVAAAGPGREVIVPSFTFPATANAVVWAGLEPVFADVDVDHWHLDPASLTALLDERGERVCAVMAVSTFGAAPPRNVSAAWERLARDAGVPLIVDSAAAFGARDEDGWRAGARGDVEVFSFHATKPFAVGEGGLVCARDPGLVKRVAQLTNFDLDAGRRPQSARGLNAKLDELHCAVALAVLEDFHAVLANRGAQAASIRALLEAEGLEFQANCESSTWQFVPVLARDAAQRERILAACADADVEARRYYRPLHKEPPFAAAAVQPLPGTEALWARQVSLPMHSRMDAGGVEAIVDAVRAGL